MDHHLEIVKTNIKYPIVFYDHQFNKSRPVSSHYHQDIEVVYVVSGKVEACIDGKKEIFYQGEMFIINSHSVHQFNFPEFTHLYTYLLSVDVFKEFQIQSYFFKLKAPSNKEWFKPWLEMKYIHHLLPIEQHILMYQLYQKLIQDCLLDKKQEENTDYMERNKSAEGPDFLGRSFRNIRLHLLLSASGRLADGFSEL